MSIETLADRAAAHARAYLSGVGERPVGATLTPDGSVPIERVQQGGVCWAGGTRWQGQPAMRISIANWTTTAADVDRSADAILAAVDAVSPAAARAAG